MRPAIAMIFEEAGLRSSIPYISAFSREGAALMTLGFMKSPSEAEAWRSLRAERRRGPGVELDWVVLPESVLRFLAIRKDKAHCLWSLLVWVRNLWKGMNGNNWTRK